MKIHVNKELLLKELAVAAKYRGKDDLSFTYLEATEEGLIIKSTDKQVYYTNLLPLQVVGDEDLETVHEVKEVGKAAITSKVEEVLRKAPGTTITINSKDNKIGVKSTDFKASVASLEPDFPSAPTGNEAGEIDSPMAFFENIVKHTGFAYSTSESRPILQGINVKGDGEAFRAVATDSYRLAAYSNPSTINFDEITIPAKAFVSALENFDAAEKLKLVSIGNDVKLVQDERVIYIKLLDGKYPDTSKLTVISDSSVKIKVDSKALVSAIDRALLFSKTEAKKTTKVIQVQQVDNTLQVFSKNEEGAIDTSIQILEQSASFDGSRAFQGGFFLDAIKAHNQKNVVLHIDAPKRPLFVTSEAQGVIQLVLPIQVG